MTVSDAAWSSYRLPSLKTILIGSLASPNPMSDAEAKTISAFISSACLQPTEVTMDKATTAIKVLKTLCNLMILSILDPTIDSRLSITKALD